MKKIIVVCLVLGLLAGIIIFNKPKGVFKGESITLPSVTPVPQQVTSGEAKSIDGAKSFLMRTIAQGEGIVSYTFLIVDEEQEYRLFSTDDKEDTYMIPANSWSPDGMYVFLIDVSSLPQSILVFKSSGEAFSDGKQYLDVTDLFAARGIQYVLDTATGWDSRGLLHIRTKNQDDTKGPSYWFDVDSRSFIQLAAR